MFVKVHLSTRIPVVRRFSESYTYDNIPSVTYWQALNADAFYCKKAQYIRTNFRPIVPGPGTFCDTPTPFSKLQKSFRYRRCRKDSLFGSYCFPACALPGISDMFCCYTGNPDDVMTQVSDYGWKQSFSYVGRPGDNAWSESFFSILKKGIVHLRFYPTRESVRQAIFEYIEVFYNRRQVQKRLGYQSPLKFLNAWQQLHLQSVA